MLTINEIMEIIPHRPPFLLIDRVESHEPGVGAIAYKNVSMNEDFFRGHFPSEPVMPGVLIIEALAQTGAVAMLSLDANKGKIAYFAGIDNAKFKRKVVPGDVIRLSCQITKVRGPLGVGTALATVNGETACEAELKFFIGE